MRRRAAARAPPGWGGGAEGGQLLGGRLGPPPLHRREAGKAAGAARRLPVSRGGAPGVPQPSPGSPGPAEPRAGEPRAAPHRGRNGPGRAGPSGDSPLITGVNQAPGPRGPAGAEGAAQGRRGGGSGERSGGRGGCRVGEGLGARPGTAGWQHGGQPMNRGQRGWEPGRSWGSLRAPSRQGGGVRGSRGLCGGWRAGMDARPALAAAPGAVSGPSPLPSLASWQEAGGRPGRGDLQGHPGIQAGPGGERGGGGTFPGGCRQEVPASTLRKLSHRLSECLGVNPGLTPGDAEAWGGRGADARGPHFDPQNITDGQEGQRHPTLVAFLVWVTTRAGGHQVPTPLLPGVSLLQAALSLCLGHHEGSLGPGARRVPQRLPGEGAAAGGR